MSAAPSVEPVSAASGRGVGSATRQRRRSSLREGMPAIRRIISSAFPAMYLRNRRALYMATEGPI